MLVIGIWGVVGYKIFSALNPDIPEINKNTIDLSFNPSINTQVDTFSIQTLSRDPFLGKLATNPNTKKSSKKVVQTEVHFPVLYHGTISISNSKNKVFIVSINGQEYFVKIGQEIDGYKLIRANTKNIVVRYRGVQKTINKV